MPLIHVLCSVCHEYSEVMRPLSMWPATPPCPKCDGLTEQRHLPPQPRALPGPVVVYQMPDGSFRFPGDPDSLATRAYDRQGGRRIELRGWAQVRPFEKHMNDVERARVARRMEKEQATREEGSRARRSELRQKMQSMTEAGRHFARVVMGRNDAKPNPKPYDTGFHVEAYSQDRSNRDESRDPRGKRRHD